MYQVRRQFPVIVPILGGPYIPTGLIFRLTLLLELQEQICTRKLRADSEGCGIHENIHSSINPVRACKVPRTFGFGTGKEAEAGKPAKYQSSPDTMLLVGFVPSIPRGLWVGTLGLLQ